MQTPQGLVSLVHLYLLHATTATAGAEDDETNTDTTAVGNIFYCFYNILAVDRLPPPKAEAVNPCQMPPRVEMGLVARSVIGGLTTIWGPAKRSRIPVVTIEQQLERTKLAF